jgi:hypothetical protein
MRGHPMALTKYRFQSYAFTVSEFIHKDDDDRWLLDPPYQRQSVWETDRRRNLIKSLLMGLPIGSIFTSFRGLHDGKTHAVVDGRQRITTLRMWFSGDFAIPADWVEDNYFDGDRADLPAMVTVNDLSLPAMREMRMSWKLPVNEANGLDLAGEANLYLLVNFGGVAQTSDDYARAAAIAGDAL